MEQHQESSIATRGQPGSTMRSGTCDRKPTGLLDMSGVEILTGDIVEFYFCADKGHSKEPDENYTRMRDIVIESDGKFYFVCGSGVSLAARHSAYCRVIGTDKSLIDT